MVAGALLLAACGNSGSGSPAASSGSSASGTKTNAITISNFMFSPTSVTVNNTVTVNNKDSVTHTLSATGGQFNTGDIGAGQSKTFTAPTKAGTHHSICNIHHYMMGTITVR